MMPFRKVPLLILTVLASLASADPTWPNDFDELEGLMYQVFNYGSRRFADLVTPCDNEDPEPGRFNSAEWLRTAFHDMATADVDLGTRGIDASLQYELHTGESEGPGFEKTLRAMAPYMSPKTSLADLIALGVYTSVRSCGGPAVPVRYGRHDATSPGPLGIPQVAQSVETFEEQFKRMGFNSTEMIQLVACGHTIGGVHSEEFPQLVPPQTLLKDVSPLDTTPSTFDSNIAVDYLNESSPNALVIGPAVALNEHSDFRVFESDGNATISAMTDDSVFQDVCQDLLGRMIDVVPSNVTLSTPIEPYDLKPHAMSLYLGVDKLKLYWLGFIRIRTTEMPVDTIANLTITFKDRLGGSSCGKYCTFPSTSHFKGTGFDEEFAVRFFTLDSHVRLPLFRP
jgi:hypothetical protein